MGLNDIESIPDLENAVVQWAQAVNPGMDEHQARTALQCYGVLRLAALSRRWHDALARWMEADDESAADESQGWPTLIDKPWPCGDQVVVPLNHAHLLKEEGRRMRHCVGSYASPCLLMGSHIFSIHDGESGESLSTFELMLANDKGVWRVELRQHRALENAQPSAACQQALRSFLSYLEAEDLQKHYADIDWKLRQRQWNSGSYEQLLRNFTWPERVVAEFRELLRGYPLLEGLPFTKGCAPLHPSTNGETENGSQA